MTFDQLRESYFEQASGLLEGGCDLFLVKHLGGGLAGGQPQGAAERRAKYQRFHERPPDELLSDGRRRDRKSCA